MVSTKNKYKKTSIGYVPVDWQILTIDDICTKKGLVRGPFGGALKKEYFVNDGIKIYEQKNAIYQNQHVGDYYIDENKFDELKRFEVKPNDFIVSCSGTIGKIFQIPKNSKKGIINQALLKITTNDEIIVDQFFYQYFIWDNFQSKIIDNTQGGAMRNLVGMDLFKQTEIPLPSLPEQQKIASILSTWDNVIDTCKTIIENLKIRNIGLAQQLLSGKMRLKSYEKSQWHLKSVEEVAVFKNGKAHENCIDVDGDYFVVNSKFISTQGKVSKASNENLCPLFKNDITMVMSDIPNGKALAKCFYIPVDDKYTLNQRICALTAKDGTDSKFLYYQMNRNNYYLAFNNGVSQTNLKKEEVLECPLLMPDIEEQTQIVKVLETADQELKSYETKLEALQLQKKGLMQQLLTGKIRVNVK
jgi:type I restriction enzyme S subunit